MSAGEWLGFIAGVFTTASFVPQVVRIFRLRSAHEISLFFNILFLGGIAIWLCYGVYLRLIPVILWNSITALLVGALLYAKLRYGKK